jgi:hypothetical protein
LRRRDEILQMAHAQATRRRNRRLMSRTLATAAIVMGLVIVSLKMQPHSTTPIAHPVIVQSSPTTAPSPSIAIEYVQTDPTITDRLTLKPQPPRWTSIGDTELLAELADAGQPAGIVCINGKTILLPRSGNR